GAPAELLGEAGNGWSMLQDIYDRAAVLFAFEQIGGAQKVLDMILRNSEIAEEKQIALCQDTGTTVLFLEMGQDVHLVGGDLPSALAEGVRQGYKEGFLRNSLVAQPFSSRINTGDNTPPIVHTDIVSGEGLKITILPKGGGCENMSRLSILRPGDGKKGIIDFTLRTIEESGGNPCPPLIVGVGVGGTAEHVMHMAKKSLLRKVGEHNPDQEVADLEEELLGLVNASGIGPQAWGGRSTALAVNIETHPTHITSLPVGVNLQCHSARSKTAEL
ncbi:MAG: fumarate hydratase, partial [Dehalococcoidia bacterium]|nr:fumarate hydratase [Dehalococcoidia bacterium]